jgi:hypothetical protein
MEKTFLIFKKQMIYVLTKMKKVRPYSTIKKYFKMRRYFLNIKNQMRIFSKNFHQMAPKFKNWLNGSKAYQIWCRNGTWRHNYLIKMFQILVMSATKEGLLNTRLGRHLLLPSMELRKISITQIRLS